MNCPYCNSPADPSNPFCRNCGQVISPAPQQQNPYMQQYGYQQIQPAKDRSILYLMIFMSWGLFSSVLWLLFDRIFLRSYLRDHAIQDYSFLYSVINTGLLIISIGLLITFTILVKNKQTRTFLIIYAIITLLIHLFYIVPALSR